MKRLDNKAIAAAASVATIVVSLLFASCEGRKMSNMTPTGETVEVVIGDNAAVDTDSIPNVL